MTTNLDLKPHAAPPTEKVETRAGPDTSAAVANLIRFLETGSVPDGLFAPDVFSDLSLPHWRIQAATDEEIVAIRADEPPLARPGAGGAGRADGARFHDRVRGAMGSRGTAMVLPGDDPG